MSQKAIFLDRDGVINQEVNYLYEIAKFRFLPGVFESCRRFQQAGYHLVVVTNQAGIGRGYYTENDFHELTDWMMNEFRKNDVNLEHVFFCPHHPTSALGEYLKKCDCRKPKPGMLLEAAETLNLNLEESIIIGDKVSDIDAGFAAGLKATILVESGHKLNDEDRKKAHLTVSGLSEWKSILEFIDKGTLTE